MDLDQAMHLERDGDGHRIRYAIADVPAFVRLGRGARPGHPRARPDRLLPRRARAAAPRGAQRGRREPAAGAVRPAFVWDLRLDADGALTSAEVYRALVRSVERLDYATVQAARRRGHRRRAVPAAARDRGAPHRAGAVPRRREPADARAAGDAREGGGFTLEFRPPVPAEDWNAQISLVTGMAAATMMLDAGVGILRTMPAPTADAVGRFRRAARASGSSGRRTSPYGDLIRGLDRTNPRHLALIHEATSLFRGAGYTAFDGAAPGAARARCRRRAVRPRHGTAAPARRPVRPRRVRGRVAGR